MQCHSLSSVIVNFHSNIRREQVESIKRDIRKRMMFRSELDYNLLREIDLASSLSRFKQMQGLEEEIVKQLFLYACSSQSDHLFYLLDEAHLAKMIATVSSRARHTDQWSLTEIRLFWILANYTSYDGSTLPSLVDSFRQMWYTPNKQIKELILVCLYNAEGSTLISMRPSFVSLLLIDMKDYMYITHEDILLRCYSLFEKVFTEVRDCEEFLPMVTHLIEQLHCTHSSLLKPILSALHMGLLHNIPSRPQILLEIDLTSMFRLLQREMDFHESKATNEPIVNMLLSICSLIYGINIPQRNQEQYQEALGNCLQYVMDTTHRILKYPFTDRLQLHLLQLLQPILLEEVFCQELLSDLKICSGIFSHADSPVLSVRRAALICLCNALRVGVEMENMVKNGVIQLLVCNLGDYVDEELNRVMLEAVVALLEGSPVDVDGDNMWGNIFQKEGGVRKVKKVTQEGKSEQLRAYAEQVFQLIQRNY